MGEAVHSALRCNPWPRGDLTLKRLLDLGYTRSRIAVELSAELRMRVTSDQVTNRGKRIGLIVVVPTEVVKREIVPITPERLGAVIAARVPVKRARSCQQPMWDDKDDPCYGTYCGHPCDGSSYCATHHAQNVVVS